MFGVDMDVDPTLDALRSGNLPSERDVFGPSLLEFIDENGGISQDESTPDGSIQSRNLHKEKITGVGGEKGGKPRIRLLVRKGGQSLVDLTQAAYEAGFIPENNTEMFLDAIDAEVGGERQAGTFEGKEEVVKFANRAAALEAELDRLGVDVKDPSLTNDAIKLILAGVGVQPGSVEEALFRGGSNLYYLFNEFLGSSKAELSGSTKTVLWQRLATAISLLNTDVDGLRDYKEINIVIDAISDVTGMDFIEFIKGEIKGAALNEVSKEETDQALFEEAWDKANSIEELSEITLSLSGSDIISTLAESMEIGDVGKVLEQEKGIAERRKARIAKEHQALIQERAEIETEIGAIEDLIDSVTEPAEEAAAVEEEAAAVEARPELDPVELENKIQALMFARNEAGEPMMPRVGELIYDPKTGGFVQTGEQKTTARQASKRTRSVK